MLHGGLMLTWGRSPRVNINLRAMSTILCFHSCNNILLEHVRYWLYIRVHMRECNGGRWIGKYLQPEKRHFNDHKGLHQWVVTQQHRTIYYAGHLSTEGASFWIFLHPVHPLALMLPENGQWHHTSVVLLIFSIPDRSQRYLCTAV